MRTAVVIPARYASTRLPGKVLLRHTGKYLVEHTFERASLCRRVDRVIVAADDPRVVAACRSFGAEVVMTDRRHASGTDRAAEVAGRLDVDVVINLQADEPLIDPAAVDSLAALLKKDGDAAAATLCCPVRSRDVYRSPDCVKVVRDGRGRALWFSRSPVPHFRGGVPDFAAGPPAAWLHLGVYAYRRDVLLRLAGLPECASERAEKLEQLRLLDAGWPMQVAEVAAAEPGVDTIEEYRRFVRLWRQQRGRRHRRAA